MAVHNHYQRVRDEANRRRLKEQQQATGSVTYTETSRAPRSILDTNAGTFPNTPSPSLETSRFPWPPATSSTSASTSMGPRPGVQGGQGSLPNPAPKTTFQNVKSQLGYGPSSKGQMELSGERISGHDGRPWAEGGRAHAEEQSHADVHDDVEIEKSNILMLGPTGGSRGLIRVLSSLV